MRTMVQHVDKKEKKVKVWFYIALYPVRWTAQSALHFQTEESATLYKHCNRIRPFSFEDYWHIKTMAT